MSERDDLIETLARHRGFLLHTAAGLTEEQARTASTVSTLTIAGLLKHVADTERLWMAFAERGADAFAWLTEATADVEDLKQEDTRFTLTDDQTLDVLRERYATVAASTEAFLGAADLDVTHPLPKAPWFAPGASWSVRRVALHVLAELSQHAGHADIIREAIDGQRTMG